MMNDAFFEIRENGVEFAGCIAEAEKLCFSEPWSLQAVEAFLSYEYNGALALLCDGAFAGYVTYSCICGELQIANVATLPMFRRMGIASYLMNRAVQTARKNRCFVITLEVRASNIPAVSLYKKHGFKEVGLRKGYYKNPKDDAVLMNLEL